MATSVRLEHPVNVYHVMYYFFNPNCDGTDCARAEDASRVRATLEELSFRGYLVERSFNDVVEHENAEHEVFLKSQLSHEDFAEQIRTCIEWRRHDSAIIIQVAQFAAIGPPYKDLDDFITTFGDKWEAESIVDKASAIVEDCQ